MNLVADAIAAAYLDLIDADKNRDSRVEDGDFIRIARIRPLVQAADADVTATLIDMAKAHDIELAPESNTKVLTADDHKAALHWGSEALHLVAIDPSYFED